MCKWEEGESSTATGPFPTPVKPTLCAATIYLFKDFSSGFQLDQLLGIVDGRAARSGGRRSHRSQDGARRQGKPSLCCAVASDQLQLMVKPHCCMLYINNI